MQYYITLVIGEWGIREVKDFKYIPVEKVNVFESFEGLEYATVLIDTDRIALTPSDDPIIEAFRRGKNLIIEKQLLAKNKPTQRDELGKVRL